MKITHRDWPIAIGSAKTSHTSCIGPGNQRGAALAVGLVLLLAMTIIGISALNTTSLEERMAGNTQEMNRAFQIAETGLSTAFDNPESFDLVQTQSAIVTSGTMHSTVSFDTTFNQFTKPQRGSNYSAINFSSAHFETESTGMTDAGATVNLSQGAYQITPSLN